ncbi:TPA: alpha/beta fold hydrolase [Pseudomonas aeruginosa]|uniref:alpha/beta fold hydrolase n=1 Tax=Pseudomonas aeruginosa TaxID=287 RepID=UPI00071B4017|nr:alpha/beta fold hydrolase [Pseudomonas aeruginosa]KSE76593.1 3-oxoadipate enol-lactonase [Pseudomonas aeruginosa]KSI21696.1 3-oxoadipate enol-lactonase [Pseudomonas aeruginosa]MDA3328786.1 alpha/beta fold hydrolase [Pseudomonas aeruginosa]WCX13843.1 alpha/beta fold hydrolase [Pseudomonas aeruginosa]
MGNLSFLATSDGASLAYRLDGAAEKPLLALSNSIGTTLHMWDAQLPALTRHFRVLRYDARGHGASSVPPGPYTLARLGEDVLELLDALEVRRAHFLGLSLGGIVGQWLAQWDERIAAVLQAEDMSETAAGFLGNWFPPALLERAEPVVERFRAMLMATNRHGLAGSFAAVRDTDLRAQLARIERPTLVIAGAYDTVTAASHGELIAASIAGARLVTLPAVHLSNVEFPQAFEGAVLSFLGAD